MTFKARLNVLLDDGVTETDETLAALVGCAASTVGAYRVEWQRRNGICGQRLRIPPEAEVEVIALRNDGFTFPAIAQAVSEQFGVSLTADQAATVYRSGGSLAALAPIPADVDADDLPLETCSGLMWRLPSKSPRGQAGRRGWSTCNVCSQRDRCERSLTDLWWYCGCERPLVWEVEHLSEI